MDGYSGEKGASMSDIKMEHGEVLRNVSVLRVSPTDRLWLALNVVPADV